MAAAMALVLAPEQQHPLIHLTQLQDIFDKDVYLAKAADVYRSARPTENLRLHSEAPIT